MFRFVGHSMSGVGVLDKAVVILAACVDGASLAELVERTKLPRATAHRLAQALEIHRLLVRDQQGRWRPGPRLGELANAAPDVLLSSAEPMLTALRDATGESAQLYLRRADERICVAAAERASGLRDTVPVGAVLPMTAGSAAQVLLAWEASPRRSATAPAGSSPRSACPARSNGSAGAPATGTPWPWSAPGNGCPA